MTKSEIMVYLSRQVGILRKDINMLDWLTYDVCIVDAKDKEEAIKEALDAESERRFSMIVLLYDHDGNGGGVIKRIPGGTYMLQYDMTLKDYTEISEYELHKMRDLIIYESGKERKIAFWFESSELKNIFLRYICSPLNVRRADIVPDNIACPDILCSVYNSDIALKFMKEGRLLSAANMNEKIDEVSNEAYPADYLEYVNFDWGDSIDADKAITVALLGKAPGEDGVMQYYTPGVRFFYKYNDLIKRKNAVFDGYHVVKFRNELSFEGLMGILIPTGCKDKFDGIVSKKYADKVIYVNENDCLTIWDWVSAAITGIKEERINL